MRTFVHNDFSIKIPESWKDESTVLLAGPFETNYRPSIAVTREKLDAPTTPQQYADGQLPAIQSEFQALGFEFLSSGDWKSADGRLSGFQISYRIGPPGSDEQVEQWQVYLVREDEAIAVTFSADMKTRESMQTLFQSAMNSFRFVGVPR